MTAEGISGDGFAKPGLKIAGKSKKAVGFTAKSREKTKKTVYKAAHKTGGWDYVKGSLPG